MGNCPAGTLRYIYVVFLLRGYVKVTFEFMLECLVLLSPPVHFARWAHRLLL